MSLLGQNGLLGNIALFHVVHLEAPFFSRQLDAEMLCELPLRGEPALGLLPVRLQELRCVCPRSRDDLRDFGERHVESPQHRD